MARRTSLALLATLACSGSRSAGREEAEGRADADPPTIGPAADADSDAASSDAAGGDLPADGPGTPDRTDGDGPACESAADCAGEGTRESVTWCEGISNWSCIDGRCLWDCGPARTCTSDAVAGCLTCDGATVCAAEPCAEGFWSCAPTIEQGTCPTFPDLGAPLTGTVLTIDAEAPCRYRAHICGGVPELGAWIDLGRGQLLGDIPGLGGTCVGTVLATGAVRAAWSCPDCQFVILGWP